MKVFLHVCCAPCALYPLSRLAAAGFETTGFFYNPNIHPFLEHEKRLAAVRSLAGLKRLPLIVREEYDLDGFLVRTAGRGAGRCEQCYRMRLREAAAAARREAVGLFTTSLLSSRHQKHDLIAGVARESAEEQGIELYYEDFRKGRQEGIAASKELGLYRQQYCGCVYSERERYDRRAGVRR